MQSGDIVFVKKAFQRQGQLELEHTPPRGHSFVCIVLDAAKTGEEGAVDPVAVMNEIGWYFDPNKVKQ